MILVHWAGYARAMNRDHETRVGGAPRRGQGERSLVTVP
jgi:hypothetical protein